MQSAIATAKWYFEAVLRRTKAQAVQPASSAVNQHSGYQSEPHLVGVVKLELWKRLASKTLFKPLKVVMWYHKEDLVAPARQTQPRYDKRVAVLQCLLQTSAHVLKKD